VGFRELKTGVGFLLAIRCGDQPVLCCLIFSQALSLLKCRVARPVPVPASLRESQPWTLLPPPTHMALALHSPLDHSK
jgi:hypothetical protein